MQDGKGAFFTYYSGMRDEYYKLDHVYAREQNYKSKVFIRTRHNRKRYIGFIRCQNNLSAELSSSK